MEIAILSDLLAHHSLTGVERYTYHLIHSLASLDRLNVTLFSHYDIPENRLPKKVSLQKKVAFKGFGKTKIFSAFQRPRKLLSYDLIHCPTVIAPLFVLRKKTKIVMTIHDLVPALFPELSNLKKAIYYKYILKYIIPHVEHFIVPSKSVQSDFVEFYNIKPEIVSVIHEGVSEKYRFGSMQKQDYILVVSTVEPRKNFKRIIEAYSYLKTKYHISEKLFIVGKRGWSCDDIYMVPKSLEKCIVFKGYVPETELIELYKNAKLLIYPSLHEGFGLPVVEAMACGCPVVTSNLSSLPEVAGDAAIFVDPYDVNDIAHAMHRLLDDERLASSFVKKGLERAKQFTWANCARETLRIYETVLDR